MEPPWPARPQTQVRGFSAGEIARLERHRAATEADYFNEGVPLARLREEGIWLAPSPSDEDASNQTP